MKYILVCLINPIETTFSLASNYLIILQINKINAINCSPNNKTNITLKKAFTR